MARKYYRARREHNVVVDIEKVMKRKLAEITRQVEEFIQQIRNEVKNADLTGTERQITYDMEMLASREDRLRRGVLGKIHEFRSDVYRSQGLPPDVIDYFNDKTETLLTNVQSVHLVAELEPLVQAMFVDHIELEQEVA